MGEVVNHLSNLAELPSVVTVGRIPPQTGWSMGPHVHGDYDELILVISGELQAIVGGRPVVGLPGQALHYPAGVIHEEASVGKLETVYVGWLTRGDPLSPVTVDDAGRIETSLRWMLTASPMVQRCLLLAVLDEAMRERTVPGPIPLALAYIEKNLAEPLTLDQIAFQAGMSRYHFAHAFTREVGVPPMRYLCEQRVRTAQALIARSNVPLRVVAEAVGLTNEFNMSRVFRRVCGKPPRDYRG